MKRIAFLIILSFFGNNIIAQNEQAFKEIQFLTSDGIKISGAIQYPSHFKQSNLPVVILIHQGGSSKEEWLALPITNKLLNNGFAVLAYDIRLHGKSGKDVKFTDLYNNPNRAPLDLLAAIEFLKKDQHIDVNRIGILGASIGANLACMAVSSDKYPVKSAVSLSAKTEAVQNLSGLTKTITPKNIFYIASEHEQNGKRVIWANELHSLSTGLKKVKIASGNKHGSYILKENTYLENEIVKWFQMSLK
ncbi:hypothetical protein GCM10011416_14530 [Polaribacter pacificus]|uniref:AB hydrolase-1 domain-containing protein n=1 Tax=Polaribacter pacificus TaxID=1775173 RepID=A0A917HYD2_9FLAO|nr:alpha/beta fold hydrolase [Polaribacter pacificus]GGG97599.1 hypothetical protein GCM10011416_14530 [Polaribacter pacificus]